MDAGKADSGNQAKDPLRQQLDELEELMQRMLALSVDASEEGLQVDLGSPGTMAEPIAYAPPYPEFDWANPQQEVGQAAVVKADDVTHSVWAAFPTFVPMHSQAVLAPGAGAEITKAPAVMAWEASAATGKAPSAVRYSIWLRPLVAVNRLYDSGTSILGPPGRLLRSAWGRNALGICGVAGLIASAVWIVWERADWNW